MKIIHFIASIDKSAGGTTAFINLLTKELNKTHELTIVTGLSPNPITIEGVKTEFFNFSLLHWFFLEKEFVHFLKDEKPDLIHINGIWNPQNGLFQKVALGLGIKVVLSPHGMLEPYILHRHWLKKRIAFKLYQDKAIRSANYIHATAQSELDNICKLGYQQPAVIIPNGIDLLEIKEKTFWDSGVKNILFLSRIHPKKGIELLIEAVAELKNENIRVTIAGEGEACYIDDLKRVTHQNGVSPLFNFIGGVYGDAKWKLLQQTDLFVLPTFSENFGIVVAEALATGIPVITTMGTPWEELEKEKCGWWIELSVDNLRKALNDALSKNLDELREMGMRGRRLIEEKYDINIVVKKMAEFYTFILSN